VAVDLKPCVAAGRGEPFFDEARKETCLQPTTYSWALLCGAAPWTQDCSQAGGAAPAATRQDEIDLVDVEQSQDCCLLDQPPQLPQARLTRHIDDGAGDRGAADSVPYRNLVWIWQPHTVPADAPDLASRPVRGNYMDDSESLVPQAEQLSRASVRENRPALAGEHGGKHPSLAADRTVSNRECPAKKRPQVAPSNPVIYSSVTKSQPPQLPPRNNAMLPLGEPCNRVPQASGALFPCHEGIRRTGTGFAPPGVSGRSKGVGLDGAGGGCGWGVAALAGAYG